MQSPSVEAYLEGWGVQGGEVRAKDQVTEPSEGFLAAVAFTLRRGEQGDGL